MNLTYWLNQALGFSIVVLLFYNVVFVFPEEKRLYETCDWKILCEKGKLSDLDKECEVYLKQTGQYDSLIHSGNPIINNMTEN